MISVCIIGSEARRTTDVLSDRDVLVVGDHPSVIDRVVSYWVEKDWNVSVFNRAAFARIAEVQSLFVQHVKQEGVILQDDGEFLLSTLKSYVPKPSYCGERNDAIRELIALKPPNGKYWHDLCLADISYVLLRNAGILHLASRNIYCFQYAELIDQLSVEFGINKADRSALQSLRLLKHGYRDRMADLEIKESLDRVISVARTISAALFDPTLSSIALGGTTDEYYLLRKLELALVAQYEPKTLDGLVPQDELYGVWQRITHASGYPKPKIALH